MLKYIILLIEEELDLLGRRYHSELKCQVHSGTLIFSGVWNIGQRLCFSKYVAIVLWKFIKILEEGNQIGYK